MQSRMELLTGIAIVVACPIVAALAASPDSTITLAVGGLAALAIGVYVGIRHPQWLAWGLAAQLGLLPFGYFPGIHVPLYLPFAAGVILAAIVHKDEPKPFHPLEKALIALVAVSAVSVVFTGRTLTDVAELIKWSIATLTVIALLRFPPELLAKFGRIYVYFATLNAVFGIAIVAADPTQRFIKIFRMFGYGLVDTGRFVFTEEGAQRFVRLGGLWVDPNMAGIGLMIAFALCLVLLTGWLRAGITLILAMAIVLTLSRSAIFSVLVGIGLVLLFHSMRTRDRSIALGSIAAVVVAAMVTPAVRTRIFSSFSSDDVGSSSRADAIREWPNQMAGHWPFGLGWGRPEFKNGATAFTLNFVANAPLITIYRAGIIVGLVFITVLLMGCVMSGKLIRSNSLPYAMYGGIFIGMCFVALQLDHMVATIPQVTLMFSVMLTFLIVIDEDRRRNRQEAHTLPSPRTEPAYSPLLR
jgi:polysaccharide biosynthesis protein PslJ